jgi:hypothetical protein
MPTIFHPILILPTSTTDVLKQQLAETKIKFFDITNEEYARAETYKSLALEMDKNNTLSTLEILGCSGDSFRF